MSVAIVTPWHNLPELWLDYKHAVTVAKPDELLIIDNGSTTPLDFAQIRFGTNRGFTAACNAGLHAAESDIVLFLNNDIELIRVDWLDRIVSKVTRGVLVGAQLRSDPHANVDGERFPYLDGWCVAGGLRHKLNQTAKTNPNVRAATLANQARYQARVRELTVAV
jgi:glycosyltransferase involved in cell wall biosynthesis